MDLWCKHLSGHKRRNMFMLIKRHIYLFPADDGDKSLKWAERPLDDYNATILTQRCNNVKVKRYLRLIKWKNKLILVHTCLKYPLTTFLGLHLVLCLKCRKTTVSIKSFHGCDHQYIDYNLQTFHFHSFLQDPLAPHPTCREHLCSPDLKKQNYS